MITILVVWRARVCLQVYYARGRRVRAQFLVCDGRRARARARAQGLPSGRGFENPLLTDIVPVAIHNGYVILSITKKMSTK